MRILFLHHPLDYSFVRNLQGVTELLIELGHDVHVLVLGGRRTLLELLHPAVKVHEQRMGATFFHYSISPRLLAARRALGLRPACPMSSPLLRLGAATAYAVGFTRLSETFDAVVSPEHRAGALWIGALSRQRIVTLVYGPLALAAPLWGFSPRRLDLRLSSRLEARMLRASDSAILPSELFRRVLTGAGWQLPGRSVVVPYILSRGSVASSTSVKESERVILVIGPVGRWKGSDVVIKAAGLLGHLAPTVRFIGSEEPGPFWDSKLAEARRLAAELGVRCELMGWRPRDEVARAYAEARVVVVASRLESFSLTALEAAHAGRPVVLSTGAGAAELRGLGAPFGVFPSEDFRALAELLDPLLCDKTRAARAGAEARSFVESAGYRQTVATGWMSALATENAAATPP